jgi:hypothetical protein
MKGLTQEEIHSFVIGLWEVLNPLDSKYPMNLETAEFTTKVEYHYYLGGRAAGFPLFCLEVFGLVKLAILIF